MKIQISELRRLIKEQLLLEFKEAETVNVGDIETAINDCFRENKLQKEEFVKGLWSKVDKPENVKNGYEFKVVCEKLTNSLNNVVKKWYDEAIVSRGKIFATKEEDQEINDKIKEVLLDKKIYGNNVADVPSSIKFISDVDAPINLIKKIDNLMQMTLDAAENVMSKPRSKSSEIDSIVARIESDLNSLKNKIAIENPTMSSSLDDLTTSTIDKIGKILQNLPNAKPLENEKNQAVTRVESFQRKRR